MLSKLRATFIGIPLFRAHWEVPGQAAQTVLESEAAHDEPALLGALQCAGDRDCGGPLTAYRAQGTDEGEVCTAPIAHL